MDLANNFQVLFQGLALGSIYALVALGFVLIIRATNVVNFAQGDFAMVGAYTLVIFLNYLKIPYGWAFLLSLLSMVAFGLVFNYGVYFPLRNRPYLNARGVHFFTKQCACNFWSTTQINSKGAKF